MPPTTRQPTTPPGTTSTNPIDLTSPPPTATTTSTDTATPTTPPISTRLRPRAQLNQPTFLTNDPTYAPSTTAPTAPPTFTIDLSLPPRLRYREVTSHFRRELRSLTTLFDDVVGEFFAGYVPLRWVHWICWVTLRGLADWEEDEEIRGIAEETGVGVYLLVAFNVLLDLFMGCSSGGAVCGVGKDGEREGKREGMDEGVVKGEDGRTRMVHWRTLDWGMDPLRKIVVQLDFVERSDGPVVASSITYAGYVGVLTGVRKGFSESLNFRPVRNEKGKFWADVKYYWHLILVLFGWRRSIASEMRKFLLGTQKGKARVKPMDYPDVVAQVKSRTFRSTVCYLCFSDGTETTVVEKDYNTTRCDTSKEFIVVTNSDLNDTNDATPVSTAAETEESPFASALQDIVHEAKDRRECAELNWRRICQKKMKRMHDRHRPRKYQSINVEDIVHLVLRFPTTNEMTHYSCIMDASSGLVLWCRRFPRPLGAKWIREHE